MESFSKTSIVMEGHFPNAGGYLEAKSLTPANRARRIHCGALHFEANVGSGVILGVASSPCTSSGRSSRLGGSVNEFSVPEYEKLKEEQAVRIAARDNILNFEVGAVSLLVAAGLSFPTAAVLLLFAPWVIGVFGWSYVQHEQKISAIGRYLARTHGSRVGWEGEPKVMVLGRRFHATVTMAILLIAFVVPCVASPLLWFAHSPQVPVGAIAVAAIDFAIGACLAVAILGTLGK